VAVPVHSGPFGRAEAERLLWRAGFGPAVGQADELAARGLDGAVSWLVNPPEFALEGPEPEIRGQLTVVVAGKRLTVPLSLTRKATGQF